MNENIKISIIIPCFNNENTIIETLDSVNNQIHKNKEIIIVNDGSTDNSKSIIEKYISNNNKNFILLNQENKGASFSRNYGANKASGKYLMFLDADDLLHETYVSKCVEVLENDKNIDIVYSEISFFEAQTGKWELNDFQITNFLINNCIPICAVFKTETFKATTGFDTNLSFAEDWDLWIQIIKLNNAVFKIPEILFYYRKRFSQDSLTDKMNIDSSCDISRLYIYNKHYDFYKQNNLSLTDLVNSYNISVKYYKKYFSVWYRKLYYNLKTDKFKKLS